MHSLAFALLLLSVALPGHTETIKPYNVLIGTRGGTTTFFLPTLHKSNDAMRLRLNATLRCLPALGAIVTETSLTEAKKFNLLDYSIKENKERHDVLPAALLPRLDALSDKIMPREYPRKFATYSNNAGLHPAHFLFILKGRVDQYIIMQRRWDAFGLPFESILHAHALEHGVDERYLENVDAAAAALTMIAPSQIAEHADDLLKLFDDKKLQYQAYIAADDMKELFESGDWTTSDIEKTNAAFLAQQTQDLVRYVVVQRTKNMMKRFDALPPHAKPALVAIGMAHFGKKDGVEAELISRGYKLKYSTGNCPLSVP